MSCVQTIASTAAAAIVATSTHAYILIDDFTQTENPRLYPTIAPTTDPFTRREVADTFGFIEGRPAQRRFAITPTAAPTLGTPAGEQVANLTDGALRFTTNGGFGFVFLEWIGTNATRELDIDASAESGIWIDYTTNVAVDVLLQLWTQDGLEVVAGNSAVVRLSPTRESVFIPFEDVALVAQAGEGNPSTGFVTRDLPPLDRGEIDHITLWIADLEPFGITRPLNHEISFKRVAFVPEPTTTLIGLAVAVGMLGCRRRF
ncbi:MAG: hypothetical protein AAF823_08835 [Planctomycetota bacterium]